MDSRALVFLLLGSASCTPGVSVGTGGDGGNSATGSTNATSTGATSTSKSTGTGACATGCADGNPCTDDMCGDGGTCIHQPRAAGSKGDPNDGTCNGVCQTDGACGLQLYTRTFPNEGPWSATPLSVAWSGTNAPPPRGILAMEHAYASDTRLFVWADDGNFYLQKDGAWASPVFISLAFPGLSASNLRATEMWQGDAASPHALLALTTGTTPRQAFAYDIDAAGNIAPNAGNPFSIGPTTGDPEGAPQDTVDCDWSFALQTAYLGTADWVIFWRHFGTKVYEYNGGNNDWMANWEDAQSPLWAGTTGGPAPQSVVAAYYNLGSVYLVAP